MTLVHRSLIDEHEPGREMVKVGPGDGATRIWICDGSMPVGQTIGLHHHGGDEIFHVTRGTVRFHLAGRNVDVGAGHYVVVPPRVEHGFRILTPDVQMQFVGEIGMGEWVTVLDADGTRREVEIRSDLFPWHRRPEPDEPFDIGEMFRLLGSTSTVFDADPEPDPEPEPGG